MSVSISMMRERVCVCMEVVLMADKFSRIEISTFGNVMEAKVRLFIELSTMTSTAKQSLMTHIHGRFTHLAVICSRCSQVSEAPL